MISCLNSLQAAATSKKPVLNKVSCHPTTVKKKHTTVKQTQVTCHLRSLQWLCSAVILELKISMFSQIIRCGMPTPQCHSESQSAPASRSSCGFAILHQWMQHVSIGHLMQAKTYKCYYSVLECILVFFQCVFSVCLSQFVHLRLASTFPIQEKQRPVKNLEGCSSSCTTTQTKITSQRQASTCGK